MKIHKWSALLTSNISTEIILSNFKWVSNTLASDLMQVILSIKPFLRASDSIHSCCVLELDTVVTLQLGYFSHSHSARLPQPHPRSYQKKHSFLFASNILILLFLDYFWVHVIESPFHAPIQSKANPPNKNNKLKKTIINSPTINPLPCFSNINMQFGRNSLCMIPFPPPTNTSNLNNSTHGAKKHSRAYN